MRSRLAGGKPGRQRPPGGDGLIELLLDQKALADLEQETGNAGIERILGDELAPVGACLGVRAPREMIGGDQKLGVEDRPLSIGTLGTVGKVGQIALPGGNGLVEFLLALKHLGILIGGRHHQFGLIAPGLVGFDLEAVFLEELRRGRQVPDRSCPVQGRRRRSGTRRGPLWDGHG